MTQKEPIDADKSQKTCKLRLPTQISPKLATSLLLARVCSGRTSILLRGVTNAGFHPVMGATNLIGSLPTAFELTTIAGRCFWISAPRVGLKSTSHISPRLGPTLLIVDNVPRLHRSPFAVLLVVCDHLVCLICQNSPPFIERQLHESTPFQCGQRQAASNRFTNHRFCILLVYQSLAYCSQRRTAYPL